MPVDVIYMCTTLQIVPWQILLGLVSKPARSEGCKPILTFRFSLCCLTDVCSADRILNTDTGVDIALP